MHDDEYVYHGGADDNEEKAPEIYDYAIFRAAARRLGPIRCAGMLSLLWPADPDADVWVEAVARLRADSGNPRPPGLDGDEDDGFGRDG